MKSKLKAVAGFQFWGEAILIVLLAAVLITAHRLAPDFLALRTQAGLSSHIWELALVALPMTLVIITGGIDLSVGSTMCLSAVVLGLLYEAGLSPWIGACAAVVTGFLAGSLNGLSVARLRVHPMIVTLATMAAYRGVAEGISLGRPISGFPESFALISTGTVLGAPIPGLVFLVAVIVSAVLLAWTPLGRSLYAIGHNEVATRFSGVSVERAKLLLYAMSGTAAGMAAVMFVARRNTAKADVGQGMELDAITAVVLGGASINGGKGRILGTAIGVLLIHEVREFISWQWDRDELNFLVLGGLLIVSVLLNSSLQRKRN